MGCRCPGSILTAVPQWPSPYLMSMFSLLISVSLVTPAHWNFSTTREEDADTVPFNPQNTSVCISCKSHDTVTNEEVNIVSPLGCCQPVPCPLWAFLTLWHSSVFQDHLVLSLALYISWSFCSFLCCCKKFCLLFHFAIWFISQHSEYLRTGVLPVSWLQLTSFDHVHSASACSPLQKLWWISDFLLPFLVCLYNLMDLSGCGERNTRCF